ncbi:uncharacterized protein L201_003035 [Kwoniella dendrophila CBS 6074]|uniref:tRNA-intron lyase n=1 Tax=Kwoniella dendrophila CBS 6074 TaxID=1295534 RepID=A0AAX4JSJ8_9TREE
MTEISSPIAGPSTPSRSAVPSNPNNNNNGKNAARLRHLANQKKYANPLPILFNGPSSSSSSSSTTTTSKSSSSSSSSKDSILSTYIPKLGFSSSSSNQIEIPNCIGIFDPITRSIWIEDAYSKQVIFQKGFFGKGSLSRSEPSWKERRLDLLKGGATLAAEQMREQRRLARKQFKIDRAAAMLDAAKQAEKVLTSSVQQQQNLPSSLSPLSQTIEINDIDDDDDNAIQEGDDSMNIDIQIQSTSPTPSTSTTTTTTENPIIDPMNLTPQTFLVRPTRPDQNRNRGRKAFKRRPPPPSTTPAAETNQEGASNPSPNESVPPISQSQSQLSSQPIQTNIIQNDGDEQEEEVEEEDLFDENLVEEMEHLQLSLEEALFLTLGLGVLKVFDPNTQTYVPNGPAILALLLTPPATLSLSNPLSTPTPMLPDDPTLVSYIAYHHYRSLGWVVKDGIKFCCDWLLYRRGPAFSHSAFACIVIPVYEDPSDKLTSPYGNEDWYDDRLSWKWINTIMRVNALVQKTVIAVYVTIPSLASFNKTCKLDNGHLDSSKVNFRDLLERYTVREVSLTRFGPARRRD